MFNIAAPDTPGVIIVEDDLLFSPDFLDYFEALSPALVNDPTLWIISAWNDNGFESKVSSKSHLGQCRRTEFFPGLGNIIILVPTQKPWMVEGKQVFISLRPEKIWISKTTAAEFLQNKKLIHSIQIE